MFPRDDELGAHSDREGELWSFAPGHLLPQERRSVREPFGDEASTSGHYVRRLTPHWRLPFVLFFVTCLSTFWAGMPLATPPITWPRLIRAGLEYSLPLMAILLCHEMGHYLQARRYRIPATLPYFIPMPISPFGTMGAVIVQSAGHADRKQLFDIAISGPLAGLVLAIPIAWLGIQQSVVIEVPAGAAVMSYGDPLLLKLMVWQKHGMLQANQDVLLNPLLFAGWVGLFLTGLNLLPIGQLDGGHILYALIGRKAHRVAQGLILAWLVYMILAQYWAFMVMVVLLWVMGIKHPPTANDDIKLSWGRTILGWSTLLLLLLCFTLQPIKILNQG
ncbi:MAG: metalloprotease [Planctomycetaceae bacterium]|nr:MAG: metalloprotease [Planctomycetaceae bacterium]